MVSPYLPIPFKRGLKLEHWLLFKMASTQNAIFCMELGVTFETLQVLTNKMIRVFGI